MKTIDLSKDDPSTLIDTRSTDYRIQGFRLGLTHEEAWNILEKNSLFLGERDGANPSRIYVYSRNDDGSKGNAVLYLIWQPSEREMSKITVFQGFHSFLSQKFRRLLTLEAIDDKSEFKRSFIGYENRSKITLDMPSIDLKHITYFYVQIGLEVTHQHSSDGDKVVFAIVQPSFEDKSVSVPSDPPSSSQKADATPSHRDYGEGKVIKPITLEKRQQRSQKPSVNFDWVPSGIVLLISLPVLLLLLVPVIFWGIALLSNPVTWVIIIVILVICCWPRN